MPVKREDAYRALEMLERYHSRLVKPQDRQLRSAIERVIRIFKGRLFQALLDIQEYYELTLLNEAKSLEEKTQETNQVVSRWERQPPILDNKEHTSNDNIHTASRSNYSLESEERQVLPLNNNLYGKVNRASKKAPSTSSQLPQTIHTHSEQWEMEEILLERGGTGLGFSIAGGVDNPHIEGDLAVYVTKVIEAGTAHLDGRLRVNDILVSVNDVNTENVTHAQTVDALKKAGRNVKLIVKRLVTTSNSGADEVTVVELVKAGRGLGFSIAGGVDSQHIEGDDGIYITKLSEKGAAKGSGMVSAGDKLIAVNDSSLQSVTHEEAVSILKATKDKVTLLISKPSATSSWPQLPPQLPSHLPPPQQRLPQRQQYNEEEEEDEDDFSPPPPPVKPKPVKKPGKKAKKGNDNKDQGVSSGSNNGTVVGREPRTIVLKKGSSGLGFNIVGEEAEGIFVSFILQGGPAYESGKILKGDQILSVNGIDMRQATHDQAAAALKGAGDTVEMMVQYRLEEYNQFEVKIHDLRQQMLNASTNSIKSNTAKGLFIRALFKYVAEEDVENPGKGVSFKFGDVFHVVSALDDDWWQVQKVIPEEDSLGVIPSQDRVERTAKAKLKNQKKKKKKNVEKVSEDENIASYEPMVQKEVDYARPVIVLGPFKDQLNNDLLSEYPEFFENCVPHTTRAKREGEVDGRDYHFVTSREQMEQDIEDHLFIEAGQYSDNLYGTSIQSVKDVAIRDKHCVLDVSANAIKRLRVANLHPIAVLIRPRNLDCLKQWSGKVSEEQCKKMYERAVKLEEEYSLYFTVMLSAKTIEEVYEEVKNSIQNHSGSLILIPAPRENEN